MIILVSCIISAFLFYPQIRGYFEFQKVDEAYQNYYKKRIEALNTGNFGMVDNLIVHDSPAAEGVESFINDEHDKGTTQQVGNAKPIDYYFNSTYTSCNFTAYVITPVKKEKWVGENKYEDKYNEGQIIAYEYKKEESGWKLYELTTQEVK